MAFDRRKYCEGCCSEEYIRTGIPQIVKEERIETPIDLPEEFDMDKEIEILANALKAGEL